MPRSSSEERSGRTGVNGWFSDVPLEEVEDKDDMEPGGTRAIGMTFVPWVPAEPVVWIEKWRSEKGLELVEVR
jgi:hypothetical protein